MGARPNVLLIYCVCQPAMFLSHHIINEGTASGCPERGAAHRNSKNGISDKDQGETHCVMRTHNIMPLKMIANKGLRLLLYRHCYC